MDESPVAHEASPAQAAAATNPFNFETQVYSVSPVKSNIGQRRGHRYKHSSISAQHQVFQEPTPRAPAVLPASLPAPTLHEAWASMRPGQRARMYWCCCHAAIAVYLFIGASGSLALTALSHLVFFDVGSAAVCVAVDVLGNFEVWRRSTIRHPFGLQRAEVLAGFALSVFLVFGGFDLLSHSIKHVLATDHSNHHGLAGSGGEVGGAYHGLETSSAAHGGAAGRRRVEPGTIDMAGLAAVVSTLVSAYGLQNHGRVRRVMRATMPSWLGGDRSLLPLAAAANPFHFLTLSFSLLLLLLPVVSVPPTYLDWADRAICAAIAVSMFVLGARLAVAQGLMLLMSYGGGSTGSLSSVKRETGDYKREAERSLGSSLRNFSPVIGSDHKVKTVTFDRDTKGENNMPSAAKYGLQRQQSSHTVSTVLREIEAEPTVVRVDGAQFWQVHYGLAMANLRLSLARDVLSSGNSYGGSGGCGSSVIGSNGSSPSSLSLSLSPSPLMSAATPGSGAEDSALSQLRARIARMVQNRLGEGYGRGASLRWEVTVQTSWAD